MLKIKFYCFLQEMENHNVLIQESGLAVMQNLQQK